MGWVWIDAVEWNKLKGGFTKGRCQNHLEGGGNLKGGPKNNNLKNNFFYQSTIAQ